MLERGDLVIHGDSKRLEQTREISRPGARPQRAANGTDEVVADGERPRRTTPNNFASEAVRSAFVPIFAKDCCERVLVESIEQLGRGRNVGRGAAIHAHVEWRVLAESEAARRIVDLMGGDPKVEQNAAESLTGKRRNLVDVREIAEKSMKATLRSEWRETGTNGVQ